MPVKGVIVAAGYGSRFLPVTRCIPKEMLPIVDRPAIDWIVQEFVDAGIEDILIITSRRKKMLEDWFDRDPELEGAMADSEAKLARLVPPKARVMFVRQQEMKGTGHALLLARTFAGNDPVVVAYPDDLFTHGNCSADLIASYERTGACVMSAVDLPGQDVSRYGVFEPMAREDGAIGVRRIVEKPKAAAPSSLVSLGRYLYIPEVFELLARGIEEHAGGEYFPTDAINALGAQGRVVAAVVDAVRWDTGQPLEYMQTVVELALEHPEIGEAFGAWLKARAAGLQ
ncbi:MAG: UTP--glucose-1-phosphate uridylyltransferase [Alphaproteobacteria bacterium]|nr:UTP--glucose-1-phosphate uridylyltransferase [Alphaproteobacteria bacterium]